MALPQFSKDFSDSEDSWSDSEASLPEFESFEPYPGFDEKVMEYYDVNSIPHLDLDDFFLDPDDHDWCEDPLHCCYPDYLDSLGDEVDVEDHTPETLVLRHKITSDTMWEDGTFTFPKFPPFKTSPYTYFLPKSGVVMHRCLEMVSRAWDADLPCEFDASKAPEFRAESAATASNPEITGEEQGTLVQTGPQPSAPAMNTLATAATGTMPDEWKIFFSYYTTVSWSTTDQSGKVLFVQRLSPRLNVYLDYLSTLYTGWSGSVDIRFTISGSGVFGGKLAAVVVPPGIDTSGGTSLLQFPHVLFDARQTEPVVFNIPDIRTVLWHGMNESETSSLVIVVYNELINPYENGERTTSCTVTVESRPGADFTFTLLKPPTRILNLGKTPSDLIPRKSILWTGNRLPGVFDGFAVYPTIGQANRHFDAQRNTHGWSTPVFKQIKVRCNDNGDKFVKLTSEDSPIIPGIADGVIDWAPKADWTRTNISANYNGQFGGFLGGFVPIATDSTTIQKLRSTVYGLCTPTEDGTVCKPSINPADFSAGDARYLGNIFVNPAFYNTGTNGDAAIGFDLNRVARVRVLPTASVRNGNYPVYFTVKFPASGGSTGITVLSSQLISMSYKLAQDSYDIGPESFAVYRLKMANSEWFDLGITAEGFCYIGLVRAPTVHLPIEASYVGIQSVGNILASNISAGSARQI